MLVRVHECLWLCLERNVASADWGKGQGSMTTTQRVHFNIKGHTTLKKELYLSNFFIWVNKSDFLLFFGLDFPHCVITCCFWFSLSEDLFQ